MNTKNITGRYILKIIFGIFILILLTDSAFSWSDTSRHFRLPVTVSMTGFERYDKPVDVSINFTQILNGLGQSDILDENSIKVVEVDNIGAVLNGSVPFQFDKDWNYDAKTRASGTIIFIMDGITQANKNRYYYIYFDLIGGYYSPTTITPYVTITDDIIDEGMPSYRIETLGGTYYFQKQAGGFSSLNDKSGNDWISWNNAAGPKGVYRGIPNAVNPEGIFHPGFTCCISNIAIEGPVKIEIRSTSNDGQWESLWDFYPNYATMTMKKAGHNYWMLYEGTPGGTFEPSIDFMYKSDGIKTFLSQNWYNDIESNEWVYFSDPNVGRSLFISHREDDTLQDEYWNDQYMTVFGFGRDGSPVLTQLLSSIPQHFTIGLIDGTNFTQNSKYINSAYKDLIITKGTAEQYYESVQLTYNSAKDRQSAWSPDGQWIAFTTTRIGSWDIFKMNKDLGESSATRLTFDDTGFDLEPSWWPNNRILFSNGPSKGYEDVWVMNNDGADVQQLTNETDFDEYPDWSPDSTKIVYSSVGGKVNGTKQIWIMNADGSNKSRLNIIDGIQPAWSPDGTKIAFKSYSGGTSNIWIMNADGSNPKRLTNETVNTHDPDWSPDGKYIAYASIKDGDWEIYMTNTDGSNKRQLTFNTFEDNYPAWSPDGQYIAFSSNRTGNDEIWLMRVNYNNSQPNLSIMSYSPTINPTTIVGTAQTFSLYLNKNADVIWYIDGYVVKSETGVLSSSYTNSMAYIGTHNVSVVATDGITTIPKEWNWTVNSIPPIIYIPPAPVITYTIGNFYVNYILKPGPGNITDGFNASVNGTDMNGTDNINISVGPHGYGNMVAMAYNDSGGLSDPVIVNVQVPNNIPVQALIGNQNVTIDNLLTFTVSAIDQDFDNITYYTNATKGILNKTTGVYSWIPNISDIGIYNWIFESKDPYNGISNETIRVTVNNVSNNTNNTNNNGGNGGGTSSSSSGSSGGIGGGSDENYYNIEFKDRKELSIYKDRVTEYLFANQKNPIVSVNITGNVNAGEITAMVEVLKNISSLLRIPAPEFVYKNINIWIGTSGFATSNNMKSAVINFRVENSWLDNNLYDNTARNNIKMVRWNHSTWVTLETSEKNRDDMYTYFEAKTDSFSHFAITKLKDKEITSTSNAIPTDVIDIPKHAVAQTYGQTSPTSSSKSDKSDLISSPKSDLIKYTVGFGVIVLILVIILAISWQKRS